MPSFWPVVSGIYSICHFQSISRAALMVRLLMQNPDLPQGVTTIIFWAVAKRNKAQITTIFNIALGGELLNGKWNGGSTQDTSSLLTVKQTTDCYQRGDLMETPSSRGSFKPSRVHATELADLGTSRDVTKMSWNSESRAPADQRH